MTYTTMIGMTKDRGEIDGYRNTLSIAILTDFLTVGNETRTLIISRISRARVSAASLWLSELLHVQSVYSRYWRTRCVDRFNGSINQLNLHKIRIIYHFIPRVS